MTVHHEANALYVASSAGIECYGYSSESGQVLKQRQRVGQSARDLVLHPSKALLFSSHDEKGIAAWRVDANGELRGVSHTGSGSLDAISITPNGRSLLAISSSAGTIIATQIDPASGNMSNLQTLVQVDSPQSLAAIYA
jgi:6-phosphogluconolactonase (cycloisomerase 2 family)